VKGAAVERLVTSTGNASHGVKAAIAAFDVD
jgi:hypothetical protein